MYEVWVWYEVITTNSDTLPFPKPEKVDIEQDPFVAEIECVRSPSTGLKFNQIFLK